MAPGPMEQAATAALAMRADLFATKQFESMEKVEIDVVDAFKRLFRDGSPMLCGALGRVAAAYY